TYALWGFVESSRMQVALLDPRGKIHETAAQLAKIREEGNAMMARLAPRDSAAGDAFSRYLLAARAATRADRVPIEQVAANWKLDAAQLGKWVAALSEEGLKQPAHPMYAWAHLSGDAPGEFASHRQKLAASLKAPGKNGPSILFKDFKDGNFD